MKLLSFLKKVRIFQRFLVDKMCKKIYISIGNNNMGKIMAKSNFEKVESVVDGCDKENYRVSYQ